MTAVSVPLKAPQSQEQHCVWSGHFGFLFLSYRETVMNIQDVEVDSPVRLAETVTP